MRPLTPLPLVGEPVALCRAGGHTCAACCYGDAVPRRRVERRLARQTALFGRLVGPWPPSRGRLLLFEALAGGVAGLVWAVLLLTPGVGDLLRPWLKRRAVCAFLGYEDEEGTRVGCLLHPTRWGGRDVRRAAAFALWRGFGCGDPGWLCLAAWRFARGGWAARRQTLRDAVGLDWFDLGRTLAD